MKVYGTGGRQETATVISGLVRLFSLDVGLSETCSTASFTISSQ